MNGREYQISRFPEDLYPTSSLDESDYNQRVLHGFDVMSKSSVSIGVLGRDIESIAPVTCARLKTLASFFRESSVSLYENDSTDNTAKIFSDAGFNVVSEKLDTLFIGIEKSLARRKRMSLIRNKLREMMLANPADYYIVYDGDIQGGFSYEGIANSFTYSWDVCGSNSIVYRIHNGELQRLYYDTWAMRDEGSYDDICGEATNLRVFNRGEPPINLFSAFGGLALYSKMYENPALSYTDEDCDHVTIHKQMKQLLNANIIMNPSQIVLYTGTRYAGNSMLCGVQ